MQKSRRNSIRDSPHILDICHNWDRLEIFHFFRDMCELQKTGKSQSTKEEKRKKRSNIESWDGNANKEIENQKFNHWSWIWSRWSERTSTFKSMPFEALQIAHVHDHVQHVTCLKFNLLSGKQRREVQWETETVSDCSQSFALLLRSRSQSRSSMDLHNEINSY